MSESTASADPAASSVPGGSEPETRLTKEPPAGRLVDTSPMRLKVAEAPLARLMPVHSNWLVPRSTNVVPPIELTALRARNPPVRVSATVAFVAGDGPWLVSVMV